MSASVGAEPRSGGYNAVIACRAEALVEVVEEAAERGTHTKKKRQRHTGPFSREFDISVDGDHVVCSR